MNGFEEQGTLLSLAEIAVAFLGFSGLVSVFIQKGDTLWARGTRFRMQIMLETSSFALVFSLLPIAIFSLGMAEEMMWRTVEGLMLALFLTFNVVYFRRTKAQRKIEKSTLSPVLMAFYIVLTPMLPLLILLNLLGVWEIAFVDLHRAVIIFWLGSAAIFFFRMIIFAHEQAQTPKKK